MRWLWQKWHAENKPWAGLEIPCTEMDRLLFNASTTITIGNGKKTRFWHHAWLDGEAPRNLAPHLFELVQRKHKIVAQELANNSWISALQYKITNATQLEEFVSLWIRIQGVALNSEIEDTITWKWTPDGIYSARSAYRAQFIGSFRNFNTELIWRARTENKCKVFAWILIQDKVLTADNLARRGWPHQASCALCNGPIETGQHLYLLCPFAQAVWSQVLSWENWSLPQQTNPANFDCISGWWEEAIKTVHKNQRRDFNGLVIYIMWNLWKERNRRIFDNKLQSVQQVAERVKEDLVLYKRAFSNTPS